MYRVHVERMFVAALACSLVGLGCGQRHDTPHGATRASGEATTNERPFQLPPSFDREPTDEPLHARRESRLPEPHYLTVDEDRVRAAGVRRLDGKHLRLYTDLPESEALPLVAVFDQAYPEWCAFFGVTTEPVSEAPRDASPPRATPWMMHGYLARDRARLAAAGLWPSSLPPITNGYCKDYQFWCDDQSTEYYRRHIVLHEGTHGFVLTRLGGDAPAWYMEGVAELLATHAWQNERLTMGYFPRHRDEAPLWGRTKIVRDEVARGRALRLADVLAFSDRSHKRNETYGWCWAAAVLLDGHPRYRDRFRALARAVEDGGFQTRFHDSFADDARGLEDEWQVFTQGLDYGYDIERMVIDFARGQPLRETGAAVVIAADRGWQSSGVWLEAGESYRISARGRYAVAQSPKTWWSEPNGVSIRYVDGRPLGILLGAIREDEVNPKSKIQNPKSHTLTSPIAIGLAETITPASSGTLYLRINDAPSQLADNAGSLEVAIQPVASD